jgi:hypothetical protein
MCRVCVHAKDQPYELQVLAPAQTHFNDTYQQLLR